MFNVRYDLDRRLLVIDTFGKPDPPVGNVRGVAREHARPVEPAQKDAIAR
jgi:hypothetical protein